MGPLRLTPVIGSLGYVCCALPNSYISTLIQTSNLKEGFLSEMLILRDLTHLTTEHCIPRQNASGLRSFHVSPKAQQIRSILSADQKYNINAESVENKTKWMTLLTDHIHGIGAGTISASRSTSFQVCRRQNCAPSFLHFHSFHSQLKDQISSAQRVEFLIKSGGPRDQTWRKRLFVLNGHFLIYYELPEVCSPSDIPNLRLVCIVFFLSWLYMLVSRVSLNLSILVEFNDSFKQ